MTDNFDEFMGYDPRSLFEKDNNQSQQSSNLNSKIYKCRPKDSKSEDGIYRAVIKVINNPFYKPDRKHTFVEQQSYAMQDVNGFFSVVSKLTNDDKSCPVFTAWKKCRYSEDPAMQKLALSVAKGGPGYFDKRFGRYCLIQVIEDENQPDLVGNYMIWKLPEAIYEKIDTKQAPTDTKKAAIPVTDFLFGRAIELEVKPGPKDPKSPERETREISYTTSEISDDIYTCTKPDGSPLLSDEDQEVLDEYIEKMKKVWKQKDASLRETMNDEVRHSDTAKKLGPIYLKALEEIKQYAPDVYVEMGYKEWSPELTARVQSYLDTVLAGKNPHEGTTTSAPVAAAINAAETELHNTPVSAPVEAEESDDDEDLPF